VNLQSEKINSILSEKRIKLHLFEPSNRKIWTVVGTEKEYWLDPDLDFCSCPGYYFNKSDGKNWCYHLESFKMATAKNKIELTTFSDYEYESFIISLLSDL
jgi:predicted nucleic acid-binding Zn finger protein